MSINREDYEDAADYLYDRFRHRRRMRLFALLAVIIVILAIAVFLYEYYKVQTIYVEGSTHYTNEEIEGFVTRGFLGNNTAILGIRYKERRIEGVPFIEAMDVDVISRNTIKVTVYERSLAGYVNYLGRYMYFSRDGEVVESSQEQLEGIPEVTGLKFDHIALYEKLPVGDETIFARILDLTQLLDKYQIAADKIYFDSKDNATVYFGDVRVGLGQDEYTDEKLSNVAKILPSLTGEKGQISLESYTPDTSYITFTRDDSRKK